MTDLPASNFRFTGWHMWGILIAFFAIVIGVNVLLAVVSARSWTGMVVDDPYVAGQKFETQRKAHEEQVRAGWSPDFLYAPGAARPAVPKAWHRLALPYRRYRGLVAREHAGWRKWLGCYPPVCRFGPPC